MSLALLNGSIVIILSCLTVFLFLCIFVSYGIDSLIKFFCGHKSCGGQEREVPLGRPRRVLLGYRAAICGMLAP